jgi:hypothetical protein
MASVFKKLTLKKDIIAHFTTLLERFQLIMVFSTILNSKNSQKKSFYVNFETPRPPHSYKKSE